ncbi:hypothetical protein [Halobacillus halophilus]|nr:hypothetical protein [Halobacillus halophilus]
MRNKKSWREDLPKVSDAKQRITSNVFVSLKTKAMLYEGPDSND